MLTLIAFAVESWGLEAAQLQAWQAFYDGVDGMSSCSKCSNRNDPCSCGWGSESWGPGVLCEGDSITKIALNGCGLSGKLSFLCHFHCHFLYGSHTLQFSFLWCNIVKNDFCQFLFSHVG